MGHAPGPSFCDSMQPTSQTRSWVLLGGEIGITVVLIYWTSPDATEQPAGALPTTEAPATVSGAPAPSLCLRPIAPSPAMTPHPIEARLAYAHCRAGNWHGIGELLAHWSLSHHDDI